MTIRNFHERNLWLGTHAERLTVTPEDGAIWTEDDTDSIFQYYAGAWHAIGGGGGGPDVNAIHVNVANEISGIANKAAPIAADMLVIEDSAAGNVKKMILVGSIGGGGHVIQEEGAPLPVEPNLNFTGNSVVASDNPGTTSTDVTIDLIDHAHSAAGDGGQLDWDNVWSDGVHDHSSAAEGGTLDWDTVWFDAVHDHSSAAEGGTIDASVLTYTPVDVTDWNGGADPGNVDDAFDQLADRTKALEGSLTMVRETLYTFAGNLILTGALSLIRFYNKLGVTETISEVFLSVDTVPTGADIIVDIHKNGVTIFTNQAHRPVIAAGANTGTTVLIDIPAWADGDYLTAHIDQIGSAIVGANLTVHVIHS